MSADRHQIGWLRNGRPTLIARWKDGHETTRLLTDEEMLKVELLRNEQDIAMQMLLREFAA